jgi:alpha-glucoside transport system permease protein
MTAPAQTTDVTQTGAVGRVAAWRPPLLRSLPLRLAVLGICLLWTIPTLGLLVTSVRDPLYITRTGWWTALFSPLDPPNQWTLSNYSTVIASDGMGNSFINSLIVTVPSVAIPITIAAFAAYAFAWVPFRGRGILFTIVVALLVVPIQMSLIPVLQIYSAGNLYGSFLGIWLAHTGFGLPLAIFLLYNFMSQLPRDLFESAAIDGASALQTFIRLVLPLSVPAIGAIAIFQFLWVWNDLLVALVFLGPGADVRVLPTALYQLIGSRGGAWHLLTAGAFVTMVVPLIVFLLLQRAFVRGILAGSVKS